jgi:hypothetical protein
VPSGNGKVPGDVLRGHNRVYNHSYSVTSSDKAKWLPLYAFHIRRKRALMSIGSLGSICSFAGTAATGHAHP